MKTHPKKNIRENRTEGLNSILGAVIRSHRNAKGLSQLAVSISAEITTTHVARIERGEKSPTFNTLYALADALNVPLWKIVKEVEESISKQ
jgi:transcriptional regulator with XRE-family HTH domain